MSGFAYQMVIAAKLETVWQALTDPEFTQNFWFGRRVVSDWRLGSPVQIIMPDGNSEMNGVVLEFDPPKRLAYSWQATAKESATEQSTTVVFELQEMGPLVKLTILHDLKAESAQFQQAAAGWTFILCGLKTFLETGKAMPALPWKKA